MAEKSHVLILGVAGGSGSGKTTFSRMLQKTLGDEVCGILSQDAYYRDMHEYFDRDGGQVNFDHPDSIEFELLVEQLHELQSNKSIRVPTYDFASHSRTLRTETFQPKPVVIVDGILLLTQSELRPMLNYAFFIETQEQVRFQRRLRRDVAERGRTAEGVIEQFTKQVKPMHDLFVEPSRKFADRIVSGEQSFEPVLQEIVANLRQSDFTELI